MQRVRTEIGYCFDLPEFYGAVIFGEPVSPWLPFGEDNLRGECDICPHPGLGNILQRARIRCVNLAHTRAVRGGNKPDRNGEVAVHVDMRWTGLFVLLEVLYLPLIVLHEGPMNLFRWCVSLAIVIGSPAWFYFNPGHFTPAAQALLSCVLFWLALELGSERAIQRATKLANDRWLPQAEKACRHLQTLGRSVLGFEAELREMCSAVARDLPELDRDRTRGIRSALDGRCRAGAQRLEDLANNLDDAIADWTRFIDANCQGGECERIRQALASHEAMLARQIGAPGLPIACASEHQDTPTVTTPDHEKSGDQIVAQAK